MILNRNRLRFIGISAAIFAIVGMGWIPKAASADEPLITDAIFGAKIQMPPQFNFVNSWEESNFRSTPFSTNPFDSRNSTQTNKTLSRGFKTVLGTCDSQTTVGCIEPVEYSLDGGKIWNTATKLASPGQRNVAFGSIAADGTWDIAHTTTYPANPSKGMFAASLPNYWELPGANASTGDKYMINATLQSNFDSGVNKLDGIELTATAGSVSNSLEPCDGWQEDFNGFESNGPHQGYCFTPVSLPANLKLRVSVKLGDRISELQGWFDGRIADANIDFGTTTPGTITVEGSPIAVDYTRTVNIPKGDALYQVSPEVEKMQGTVGTGGINLPTDGIESFQKFASKIPKAAVARNLVWRVSSWNKPGSLGNCQSTPGVKGIVLTNATAYDSNPPTLDKSDGSLKFLVASTHLNPDNSLNLGEYTLFLRQSLAKCIWGETLNGSASVSVVDEDGTSDPATTSMSVAKGWVIFHAAAYHYSVPTIRVKIVSEKTSQTKPSAAITCMKSSKGKSTSKTIKVGQKCPSGYKLKR